MGKAGSEKLPRRLRILVAPLDWGLGHATRCIPVIHELLNQGCEVLLAGEGAQQALLKAEFPNLPFLPLQGYRIRYTRIKKLLSWKIIMQLPRIFFAVKKEHRWLRKIVKLHHVDAVIADNRFGLFHKKIPCVFITHQLRIKSPFGNWSENILQRWNYRYINRFTACWVPDVKEDSLAGELSHPLMSPKTPVNYIGPLSRFEKKEVPEIKDRLLIILTGPEPQRSIFEEKIVREICHYPASATVVRGLPLSQSVIPSSNMIKFYNHLSANELGEEMGKAEWIISRCGYSTVMDVVKMKKKTILIPTPGQTEQEYLAETLQQKRIAYCVSQQKFSIASILEDARKFHYHIPSLNSSSQMKEIVAEFVAGLSRRV
jgi:uncharacterized protein (TIGR00661 family)